MGFDKEVLKGCSLSAALNTGKLSTVYARRYNWKKKWASANKPDTRGITLPYVRLQHIDVKAVGR